MIDLKPKHAQIVRGILTEFASDCEVLVFGSRAMGTAKPWSDLDLLVRGETKLPLRRIGRLREAFEDSDLPFRVDVVDWYAISDAFRARILTQATIIWSPVQFHEVTASVQQPADVE